MIWDSLRWALALLATVVLLGVGRAHAETFASAEAQEFRLRQAWSQMGEERSMRTVDEKAREHVEAFERAEGTAEPLPGSNGRVVYFFGAQVPRVMCRPMMVCDIELEEGENLVDWFSGDQHRWQITNSVTGAGAQARSHLLIKPMATGFIETNLVVHTDRRAYHFDLLSPTDTPMRFVSFQYPRTGTRVFTEAMREAREAGGLEEHRDSTRDDYTLRVPPWKVHQDYTIEVEGRRRARKHARIWAPTRAFDDGEKTFIQLPDAILARERPVLFVENAAGEYGPVEYRSKSTMLLVDRLFERAYLVLGSGRHQERVSIVREP